MALPSRFFTKLILAAVALALLPVTPAIRAQAVAEPETSQADVAPQTDTAAAKEDSKSEKQPEQTKFSPGDSEQFMRIRKDAQGKKVAMETSITRYETTNDDGQRVTVDLIGAVHIGEKDYYEQLNKQFKKYEAVLYELVAPKGTVIPKGGRGKEATMNPVAALQKGMQSVLGLEFQLDHIDYTQKNFIHADMSPEEFGESMAKNDESLSKYAFRAIGQSMAMQSQAKSGSEMGMLLAMFSNNKEVRMRRAFAEQMQDMDAGMVVFQGRDGSTIIDHRNAKCMEVLEREIADGKTNLAIFYGAGHLPDMQKRLEKDFGMKRGGQKWLRAWNLEMPVEK